jgi:hypothetical protein
MGPIANADDVKASACLITWKISHQLYQRLLCRLSIDLDTILNDHTLRLAAQLVSARLQLDLCLQMIRVDDF